MGFCSRGGNRGRSNQEAAAAAGIRACAGTVSKGNDLRAAAVVVTAASVYS